MATLAYSNDAGGMRVDASDDLLVVRWPVPRAGPRRVLAVVNLIVTVASFALVYPPPAFLGRALFLKPTPGDPIFAALVAINALMAAHELWVTYRWGAVAPTLTISRDRVCLRRMGVWSPRTIGLPLTAATTVDCEPIRRPFRSAADATRVTIRTGRRRVRFVLRDSDWPVVRPVQRQVAEWVSAD